ncbi:unnamed protein product [Caenorhabditis bovis]|uniref:Uncharacterized protein n=1 Tax=Caenorhabditis bovis TaxID=2654633 RepID=A0A8S1ESM7_9PELO|nr:unnamed protein product [Caenorhabditis bovis]
MALLYPFHLPNLPLNWAEHMWLPEISPTNESFITTVFDHRETATTNAELLRHLSDNVARIAHDEPEYEIQTSTRIRESS